MAIVGTYFKIYKISVLYLRFSFHKKYIGSRDEEYNIYGWKVNIDLNILFQDNNIAKGFLVVSLVQYARAITYLTFP